jgi:hypothetical protein
MIHVLKPKKGIGFMIHALKPKKGIGFIIHALKPNVLCFRPVDSWLKVDGFGFRVWGLGFRV